MSPVLDLVSPAPAPWMPLLWDWLHEDPAANLDDYAPTTLEAFGLEMARRATVERTWGVTRDGHPVGVIAYRPCTPRLGMFHGICFAAPVCGTGLPRAAVGRVLDQLWQAGVDKIEIGHFADNGRVGRFLAKLGAVPEGVRRAHTVRGGHLVDLALLAIFNPRGKAGA